MSKLKGPFRVSDHGYDVLDRQGQIICEGGSWRDEDAEYSDRRETAEQVCAALNVVYYIDIARGVIE